MSRYSEYEENYEGETRDNNVISVGMLTKLLVLEVALYTIVDAVIIVGSGHHI